MESHNSQFIKPRIEITAIGEENLVYNLTNQYSITEGQVLETLAGVCDGRCNRFKWYLYTENVTTKQDGTGKLWNALTGSTIDYKPPPGTRQVIYKLNFHVSLIVGVTT